MIPTPRNGHLFKRSYLQPLSDGAPMMLHRRLFRILWMNKQAVASAVRAYRLALGTMVH